MFKDRIKKMVINFDEVGPEYDSSTQKTNPVSSFESAPITMNMTMSSGNDSSYVIITTNAIADNSTKLSEFVTHKESKGFDV